MDKNHGKGHWKIGEIFFIFFYGGEIYSEIKIK